MGYYSDLDDFYGDGKQAEADLREIQRERQAKERALNRKITKAVNKAMCSAKESKTRGSKVTVKCACCGGEFQARKADVARGWGKYCSKSCKGMS